MAEKGKQESSLTTWRVRLGYLFRYMGRVVHYGLVPFILYLGLRLGQPDPNMAPISVRSLIW